MNKKKWLLLDSNKKGFVSLCVMQALALVMSFCGVVIHQVQRMSEAEKARLQSLSDKSLIKVLSASIINILNDTSYSHSLIKLQVDHGGGIVDLLVKPVKEDGNEKICKIEILNERDFVRYWAYLLLVKNEETGCWSYRCIQFGSAL